MEEFAVGSVPTLAKAAVGKQCSVAGRQKPKANNQLPVAVLQLQKLFLYPFKAQGSQHTA